MRNRHHPASSLAELGYPPAVAVFAAGPCCELVILLIARGGEYRWDRGHIDRHGAWRCPTLSEQAKWRVGAWRYPDGQWRHGAPEAIDVTTVNRARCPEIRGLFAECDAEGVAA